MSHSASSTLSILIIVVLYNGTLLTTLALYLWRNRGHKFLR